MRLAPPRIAPGLEEGPKNALTVFGPSCLIMKVPKEASLNPAIPDSPDELVFSGFTQRLILLDDPLT